MARFPSGFWGPRPRWALIPLLAVAGFVAAIAPDRASTGPVAVTVLKPASGDAALDLSDAGEIPAVMPIEVRYGVPSPQTAWLWTERRPG